MRRTHCCCSLIQEMIEARAVNERRRSASSSCTAHVLVSAQASAAVLLFSLSFPLWQYFICHRIPSSPHLLINKVLRKWGMMIWLRERC